MICFGKGVTNGAAPLGGVLVRDGIHAAFMQCPEYVPELAHGFTYSGHPLGIAAGLASLELYRDQGLFERGRALESVFADAVHGLKGSPHIIDIRTIGLATGIDLSPIDGSPGLRGAHTLDCAFFDEDLVIRAVGDTIVLAPALIASEEHRRHRGQACRHSAALALNQPTWPKVASLLSLEARGTGLLLLYSGLSPMFFMRARGQVAQR
jgi:beta-alanine--pyruvate transaminase